MKHSNPSLTLYAAPMSSASPVRMALAELDIPHEVVLFDLSKGEQKAPAFLALNPWGRVPTLVIDGTPMFEALAIMQWLGDRYGVERKLWPRMDDPSRIEALSWSTWAYAGYSPLVRVLMHASSSYVPAEHHNAVLAQHTQTELQAALAVLDTRLAKGPFLLGKSYTLADTIVASAVTWSTYCGVSVEGHAHVGPWLELFRARPAFRQTWE